MTWRLLDDRTHQPIPREEEKHALVRIAVSTFGTGEITVHELDASLDGQHALRADLTELILRYGRQRHGVFTTNTTRLPADDEDAAAPAPPPGGVPPGDYGAPAPAVLADDERTADLREAFEEGDSAARAHAADLLDSGHSPEYVARLLRVPLVDVRRAWDRGGWVGVAGKVTTP